MTNSDGPFETHFRQDTPVLFSLYLVVFTQMCTLQRADHQRDVMLLTVGATHVEVSGLKGVLVH